MSIQKIEIARSQDDSGMVAGQQSLKAAYQPPRFERHDLRLITLAGSLPIQGDTFNTDFVADSDQDDGWSEEDPDYYG